MGESQYLCSKNSLISLLNFIPRFPWNWYLITFPVYSRHLLHREDMGSEKFIKFLSISSQFEEWFIIMGHQWQRDAEWEPVINCTSCFIDGICWVLRLDIVSGGMYPMDYAVQYSKLHLNHIYRHVSHNSRYWFSKIRGYLKLFGG